MKMIDVSNKETVAIDVKKGESYWCCTCGKSKTQPLCDGSHKDSECEPFKYTATEDTTEWFCSNKESISATKN